MTLQELGRYEIIIDLDNLFTRESTEIVFKQGEVGTSLVRAKLVKGRQVLDLTGCTVITKVLTSKGDLLDATTSISTSTEGIVEISFPSNTLTTGTNFFELSISKDNIKKKSPKIMYMVGDSITGDN